MHPTFYKKLPSLLHFSTIFIFVSTNMYNAAIPELFVMIIINGYY